MKRRFRRKYLWFSPILLLIILNLSGCFQFRMSNKKKVKYFAKRHLTVATAQYHVGNREMNYVFYADDDTSKPVAIYFHGSPGSSQDFFRTMRDSTFVANFIGVSVDRPGFGHSDFGRAEPSLKEQAKDVKPVLEKYKDRKVVLLGHSYGGPVICKLAMEYPELVDGLVILAGSVAPELEPDEWWRKPMDSKAIRWLIPRSMVASNQEIMPLKDELTAMLPDWEKIECPVVIVQGTKDKLVPPANADFADSMLVNCSHKQINRIEGMNHFIPFMREDLIVDALLEIRPHL